jgi:hypothetical protein
MPTITIRLTNLPKCCRQCLEKCPECVLRAELWRQATWQLSQTVPQNSPRFLVEYQMESQSPALAEPQPERHKSIKETILHRAQGARRTKKSRSSLGRRKTG